MTRAGRRDPKTPTPGEDDSSGVAASGLGGSELVVLGAVVHAHGLRGEVKVIAFNKDSMLLKEAKELFVAGKPYVVQRSRKTPKHFIIKLAGIETRDAAEAIRKSEVAMPRDALPPLDEDEFYFTDLIGSIVEIEGQDEETKVTDIVDYPTVTCLCLVVDGLIYEVPVLDRYIKDLDIEGGRIWVQHFDELSSVGKVKKRRGKKPKPTKPATDAAPSGSAETNSVSSESE